MNDLNRQLRDYIDGIADPVTMDEAPGRLPSPPRPRRVTPAAAALAGAALVLIPALVLGAIRLWPSDDTATPTTSVSSTTTSVPGTVVTVPDVVAMPVGDARSTLEAAGFLVEIVGDGSEDAVVTSQDPASGAAASPGETVRLEAAGAVGCADGWAPTLPAPAPGDVEIDVLFQCGTSEYPDVSTPVVRRVPGDVDPVRAMLDALLAGPDAAERAAGFSSFFSQSSAGALESVSVVDGRAVVDFNEGIYIDNASTTLGSRFFLAELNANLFAFASIQEIEYLVGGTCEAFWEDWLPFTCTIQQRGDWEYQVSLWDELRPGGSTVVTPIPPEGLGAGILLSEITAEGDHIVWRPADSSGSSPDGMEILRFPRSTIGRLVASDRAGGLIYQVGDLLRWMRAGVADPVDLGALAGADRIEVVEYADGATTRRALITSTWDGTDLAAYDLPTMAQLVPDQVRAASALRYPFGVRIDTATERTPGVDEYYDDAYPDYLVVTVRLAEVLRLRVTTDDEPYVTLHDYDGRRILISRYPYEPAAAPETYFLIDLECGWECTRAWYTGGYARGALTGDPEPASSTGGGWPGGTFPSCSAEGLSIDPADQGDLPPEVADKRRNLMFAAAVCDIPVLEGWLSHDGTEMAFGIGDLGSTPLAALEGSQIATATPQSGFSARGPLAELYGTLQQPFESYDRNGAMTYVWPGLALPTRDFGALSDAEAATLAATYGRDLVDESRRLGYFAGWRVEIDAAGRWVFFGMNVS